MKLVGLSFIYQGNFPKSKSGSLSDVYYTIYNSDGTVYQARGQSGVVELGDGAYGVLLTFSERGNWSIHWDIDSTSYVANEEINIYNDDIVYIADAL